ncbi:MAG TPA: arginase family protein [Paracoccaceae bacterium]|nr:arginase family protein [Paracoccaceae bacterium]
MADAKTIGEMFGASAADTFLGLPAGDLSHLTARGEIRGAILGVPGCTPYGSVGAYCADGPAAIRAALAGYAANLGHVDFDAGRPIFAAEPNVVDCGDLPFDPGNYAANRGRAREAVGRILDAGAVPILLGGDDSIPIPMLEAYEGRGRFTILQIDAHIDWRDEVQGERHGLSSGMRRASEMGHIERIIQVGQRNIGSARPSDLADAREWGVEFIPARGVAQAGITTAIEMIPEGSDIIIALDCDALDPSVLPAVMARAPGGLGYWDVINLIEGASLRGRLAGFEIAELMPARDVDGLGAEIAARIVANVVRLVANPQEC